ncbi:phage integrase family protein [Caballeronia telluris]|uniref:Phage integrase family protein n=1 Tax=Caballeronia telluris TaxID=326475 RepID=A0A158KBK6_9BURK|nr:phage integrase family protein [Caballeronia telluris]
MKTRETHPIAFPDDAELAALRAWYAGLGARAAVARYLGDRKARGASARGVLGRIRRALISYAASHHRADLAEIFIGEQSAGSADTVARVIETLRSLPAPVPHIADEIDRWLPPRVVAALRAHGIRTLADLTVRIPRRRRWWTAIAGLGVASARRVETFFAAYPALTERARAACEKLRECHGLVLSKETVRHLMTDAGLWVPRKQRPPKVYQPRARRACFGELVQIDGSDHHWFEDRGLACTLLVFVDDATSRLMHLHFAPTESTFSYFEATRAYLERHGKPVAFYSDRASVFYVHKREET